MSELSSAYGEYERMSALFRQLNHASLLARRVVLGINPPSDEEQRGVRDQLDDALRTLSATRELQTSTSVPLALTLEEVLRQAPNTSRDVSCTDVLAIRRHIESGLASLTPEDLDTIDKITDALDSASEVLFRHIQR
ncbi:MAG: hypothetical protein QOE96_3779 [Blastocatellia bacterium]|jgi:hypothetical protein|nr:hypothetical protein [Blastocatellia bacterium]